MDISLVKYSKKTNSKIEQATIFLSLHCYLANIKLSRTELIVLSYFLVYKIKDSTKELILKAKLLKSEDSLSNTMSKLRKVGLIKKKENGEDILSDSVNIELENVLGILIKVDNS